MIMLSNRIKLLIILTVAWFWTMCDRYVTQMLFPVFETLFMTLTMIPNELVLIVSTEAVWWAGYSTSAIIGGKLSDKFLRQHLITFTLTFYFLNTFLISFSGANFSIFTINQKQMGSLFQAQFLQMQLLQ